MYTPPPVGANCVHPFFHTSDYTGERSSPLHLSQRSLRIAHKNTPKKFFEKILKKGLQFIKSCAIITELSARQWYALLAQLDRASGYGPEGQGFESLRACQKPRNRKVSGFFCFSPKVLYHFVGAAPSTPHIITQGTEFSVRCFIVLYYALPLRVFLRRN